MLETEAAVLKERNTAAQQVLDGVKQEAASQQAAFVGASVEFESKLAKQDASSTMLVEAERGRGDALEREAADAKRTSAGLKKRVEQLQEEMEYLTSRGEGVEGEKVAVLKAMVGELETTNRDVIARAASIRERYSGGTLVGLFIVSLEEFQTDVVPL
jgi:chromosome segregation ATPase